MQFQLVLILLEMKQWFLWLVLFTLGLVVIHRIYLIGFVSKSCFDKFHELKWLSLCMHVVKLYANNSWNNIEVVSYGQCNFANITQLFVVCFRHLKKTSVEEQMLICITLQNHFPYELSGRIGQAGLRLTILSCWYSLAIM